METKLKTLIRGALMADAGTKTTAPAPQGRSAGTQPFSSSRILFMVTLAAFCASVPFFLPNLDILHRIMLPGIGDPAPIVAVSSGLTLLRVASLAAMFTALGMLLVCLLKTAFGRLTMRFVLLGAVTYLVGIVMVSVVIPLVDLPVEWDRVAMVLLGFGVAVLAMAWIAQVESAGFVGIARTLVLLFAVASAFDWLLLLVPDMVSGALRTIMALIGTIGCLLGFRTQEYASVTVPGSNWWDIFGRLDVSLIDEADGFDSTRTRVLFFIVTPAIVMLLLVLGMDIHHNALGDEFPIEQVGGIIASVLAVPLLLIRTDRLSVQTAYRVYLPVAGAAVFVAGNFVDASIHSLVMNLGIYVFCSLYGLMMAAFVLTMAARMPSLRLPSACLLVLVTCILATVSYMKVDAGMLVAYRLTFVMALLVAAIALLAIAPSTHAWSLAFADPRTLAAMTEPETGMTLEDRCSAVARVYGLTPREGEILRYLGRGHGSAFIANELVVAESTVRSHVKSIYRKTEVSSREQLLECIDHIEERSA